MDTLSTPPDRPALSLLDLAPIRHGHTVGDALHRTVELAAYAERLGFHRYWLAEHHNMAPMASSANIILAGAVAAGTGPSGSAPAVSICPTTRRSSWPSRSAH